MSQSPDSIMPLQEPTRHPNKAGSQGLQSVGILRLQMIWLFDCMSTFFPRYCRSTDVGQSWKQMTQHA